MNVLRSTPRLALTVLILTATLPALAQEVGAMPTPAPLPEAVSPWTRADTTAVRLLPAQTEVPWLGGEVPPGTHVVNGHNPTMMFVGKSLFFGGMAVQGVSVALVFLTGLVGLAGGGMLGLIGGPLLMAGSLLLAVPVLPPLIIGLVKLAAVGFQAYALDLLIFVGIPLLVAAAEVAGVIVMLASGQKRVHYDVEAPAYPSAGSGVGTTRFEGGLVALRF